MWDQVVAITEKMMVFMDRPDRILTAVPFINTYTGGSNGGESPESAFSTNLFVQQDDGAGGVEIVETTVATFYRLMHDVRGDYVNLDVGGFDVQAQAFRDVNTLYVLLNNLDTSARTVSLDVMAGQFGTVDSAIRRRLRYISNVADYDSGTSIPVSSLSSLTLDPQEKSVLILTLGGSQTYDGATNERIFYGTGGSLTPNVIPIPASREVTSTVTLDLSRAVAAKLRFGFFRPDDTVVPTVILRVNGESLFVPGGGLLGYDDTDARVSSREIEVPLSLLNNGANTVTAVFPTSGGHFTSLVALVEETLGDFNGNQVFDFSDRLALEGRVGQSVNSTNEHYDLNGDGFITADDVLFFDTLRGAIMVMPFRLTTGPGGTDAVLLNWTSRTGASYLIEASSTLAAGSWTEVATSVPSGGTTTTFTDTSAFAALDQAFYRISEN